MNSPIEVEVEIPNKYSPIPNSGPGEYFERMRLIHLERRATLDASTSSMSTLDTTLDTTVDINNEHSQVDLDETTEAIWEGGASGEIPSLYPPADPPAKVQEGDEPGRHAKHNRNKKDRAKKAKEDQRLVIEKNKELEKIVEEKEQERRVIEEDRERILERRKQEDREIAEKKAEAVRMKEEAKKKEEEAKKKIEKAERIVKNGGKKGMTAEQYDDLRFRLAPQTDRANADFANHLENQPYYPFTREDMEDLKDTEIKGRAIKDPCETCVGAKKVEGEIKAKVENLQLRIDMRDSEIKKMKKEMEEKENELKIYSKRRCNSGCKEENEPKRQKTNNNEQPLNFPRQIIPKHVVERTKTGGSATGTGTSGETKSSSDHQPPESLPEQNAMPGEASSGVEGGEWNNRGIKRGSYRGTFKGRGFGSNRNQPSSQMRYTSNIFFCFRCNGEGHIARNCPEPDPRRIETKKTREEKEKNNIEKKEKIPAKVRLGPKPKPINNDGYIPMEIIEPKKVTDGFKIPKMSNKEARFQQRDSRNADPEEPTTSRDARRNVGRSFGTSERRNVGRNADRNRIVEREVERNNEAEGGAVEDGAGNNDTGSENSGNNEADFLQVNIPDEERDELE